MGYFLCITESAIIEDPSVIYEGGVYLPEPVTLENYLVYLSKCYNIYVEFCNFKRCFVLPYCVDGKPMSLEMKHVVSTYLLCCRFPLISLTFLKTFWREKLTLKKILIKMRYANIWDFKHFCNIFENETCWCQSLLIVTSPQVQKDIPIVSWWILNCVLW